jgi:hypothetical protein
MDARDTKTIGYAKRVRVRLPFGATRQAWDCRPFGGGRIVAPTLATAVEISRAMWLDLRSGEVRAAQTTARAA